MRLIKNLSRLSAWYGSYCESLVAEFYNSHYTLLTCSLSTIGLSNGEVYTRKTGFWR